MKQQKAAKKLLLQLKKKTTTDPLIPIRLDGRFGAMAPIGRSRP
jgi:hypothetical protein